MFRFFFLNVLTDELTNPKLLKYSDKIVLRSQNKAEDNVVVDIK